MGHFLASRPVVVLLVAAFLLRAGMAFVVQGLLDHHWKRQFVIEGDAQGYWALGKALAAGEPYAIYEPPRYVLRMPGFPLLLSVPIRLSEGSFLITRLFLAGIGTVAVGLVYLLGRELINDRIGLIAGWFTAVSPAMVGFSVMILSETPFALGVVGSVWAMACLLRAVSEQKSLGRVLSWALATGGFVALATYMRPSWLPMALIFPLGLLIFGRYSREAVWGLINDGLTWKLSSICWPLRREALLAGAALGFTVFLLLFPWAARNHRITGHWVFTTLWSGPSLYDGLNPEATGESDMTFFDRDNLMASMSEYEVNRHYWQAGWEYARNHPWRTVELGLIKLWRFWKPWPSAEEAGGWPSKLIMAGFSLALYLGCLVGVWWYRRNIPLLALTLGPVLFFSALHAVFVGSLRYRLPAEYPMAVLAAAGWCEIARRFATSRASEVQP